MAASAETQHRKWLEKMAREADRQALKRAREAVRVARAARREAVRKARAACKRARKRVREWVTRERERLRKHIVELRAKLKARIDREREKVRQCCGAGKERAKAEATKRLEQARAELAELRSRKARERIWSTKQPLTTRAERKRESDHEVELNLSPEELIVWRAVKRDLKPSDRMSRYEALTHWMHDHGADVQRILEDHHERELQRAIANEQKEREAMRALDYRRAKPGQLRKRVARAMELEAVPF